MDSSDYARIAHGNRDMGFQGCSNLGKGCDFNGFYLCSYSEEGLCKNCEIDEYPERFHGCIFCRRVHHGGYCCYSCSDGFYKWVMRNTNIDENLAVHKLCHNNRKIVSLPFINKNKNLFHGWPGFYVGNDEWIKPDMKMKTNKVVTFDNNHEVLEELLNENGIDIYAEIQLKV